MSGNRDTGTLGGVQTFLMLENMISKWHSASLWDVLHLSSRWHEKSVQGLHISEEGEIWRWMWRLRLGYEWRGLKKEKKKTCREWQQNGRDIYEVKEQLGGQGVPWDNNHKMKSEILVSDFWSRAVTSQDPSFSHGNWWLKLSRDLAHGCNKVSPEPQNVRVTWAGPLFQFPPEELWKHFCQWRIQFWFTATLKSLLYSPMADIGKNHQNIVKVIILQLK